MPLFLGKRVKWAAAVFGGLVLWLAWILCRPQPALEVKVAAVHQPSVGVLVVTVVLTNGTEHAFSIADDLDGKAAFLLDDGSASSDTFGTWLRPLANQKRIQLAPGTSLTQTLWLTNPPPRFRLRTDASDLAVRGRGLPFYRVVGRAVVAQIQAWRRKMLPPQIPTSGWIESNRAGE